MKPVINKEVMRKALLAKTKPAKKEKGEKEEKNEKKEYH